MSNGESSPGPDAPIRYLSAVEPVPGARGGLGPTTLRIAAWVDPVIDELGHDPRSRYVEQFWLGALGPSTTWWLRHVAHRLDAAPDGFEMDLAETAASLGLGGRGGKHSPFVRSIERACQFHMARRTGDATVEVRRRLPPLGQGQARRLPEHLQRAHRRMLDDAIRIRSDPRTRRLALAIVECGGSPDGAARALRSLDASDAVIADALEWAHRRHRAAAAAATMGLGGGDAA